ncbi:hypothetical protein MP638_002337 [Amoeboaphelidium occidentale]|nr:hypothetical protein MP638_002337 [Amoeboaphelidium occidentale]
MAPKTKQLKLEFSGGMELLFDNQRSIAVSVPEHYKVADLLPWMRDNLIKAKPELFMAGDTIRPGVLVLINDSDWELEGELEYQLKDKDSVVFISTLHGGILHASGISGYDGKFKELVCVLTQTQLQDCSVSFQNQFMATSLNNIFSRSISLLVLCGMICMLDHEKSFLLQDGAANIDSLSLYQDCILITSLNDVVQKDIETGAIQRTFRAHSNGISSLLITNDSRMITAGLDDKVIIWDLVTGSVLKRISLGLTNTLVVAIYLQDNQLRVGSRDATLRRIDLISGRTINTRKIARSLIAVETYGNFLYVAGAFDFGLMKVDINNFNIIRGLSGHAATVNCLHLFDKILFSGGADNVIIAWNVENDSIIRLFSGHTDSVVALLAVDSYLFSGSSDRDIFKWNINDGQIVSRFSRTHQQPIRCLAHKNGRLFSGSDDASVVRWNATNGIIEKIYNGVNRQLRSVVLWKNLAITCGDNQQIWFWDVAINSIEPQTILTDHFAAVNCLFVYKDTLFSGSTDLNIRHWNLTTLSNIKIFKGHTSTVSTIVAQEPFMYSGGYDLVIRQWAIATAENTAVVSGQTIQICSLKIRSNFLYSAAKDSSIRSFNLATSVSRSYSAGGAIFSVFVAEDSILVGTLGVERYLISTGETAASFKDISLAFDVIFNGYFVFTAHADNLIRSRDYGSLGIVSTFAGHVDSVLSLSFDEAGLLYSASFDGAVKKWNVGTGRVAFSFEIRTNAVTALAVVNNVLAVGTKSGVINFYNIDNAIVLDSRNDSQKSVASMISIDNDIYAAGLDGSVLRYIAGSKFDHTVIFQRSGKSLKSLSFSLGYLFILESDVEIFSIPLELTLNQTKQIISLTPLVCIFATQDYVIAGSRSGRVLLWGLQSSISPFDLEGHNAQVNSVIVNDGIIYSASDDNTIIQWSLADKTAIRILKRSSFIALGHLGPVNSLAICYGVLFSGSSDLTVRRWNTQTGAHEDAYSGFLKAVTAVLCHNGTVFAGSQDFSVLSFNPEFRSSSRLTTSSHINDRRIKVLQRARTSESQTTTIQNVIIVAAIVLLVVFVAFCLILVKFKKGENSISSPPINSSEQETTATVTDLQTVINSIIGISKHAAFLINGSSVAKIRLLASGGGGSIYLAKLMDKTLKAENGDQVIQKLVHISNKSTEEAFYQEVGIMIMLSNFPNFCKIIAYTENPVSIILKYYPDGSLFQWIQKNKFQRKHAVKILKEISQALTKMHYSFLAHCDLKTQNVLIEISNGTPTCFLTDFGITQILSDRVLASKLFHVINLRGLSINYASPEAFTNFRKKQYNGVDFKKYDVYSFACVILEVLTSKTPWS